MMTQKEVTFARASPGYPEVVGVLGGLQCGFNIDVML